MRDSILALIVILGAVFVLIGSLALVRLPDIFTRLHGPAETSTLGVGALAMAAVLHAALIEARYDLRPIAIAALVLIASPIVVNMIAKAVTGHHSRNDTPGA